MPKISKTSAQPPTPEFIQLGNARARVVFNLGKGTFDLDDLSCTLIQTAHARIETWSSCDADYKRHGTIVAFSDELGSGNRLTIECASPKNPSLLLEFNIYDGDSSAIVLRTGLKNTGREALRVRRFFPLANGHIAPDVKWSDAQTLSGNSACHQPEVVRSRHASSSNNLLLTFKEKENGKRRSIVLGALKTAEFMKWAHTRPEDGFEGRAAMLSRALPGAKLAAHLDCRTRYESLLLEGPRLGVLQGERDLHGILVHPKEIHIGMDNLDRGKQYAAGFTWRDHGGAARSGSMIVCSANGKSQALVQKRALPSGPDGEEIVVLLPQEFSGHPRSWLQFANESGASTIALGEVWLWELSPGAVIPQDWANGRPVSGKPSKAADATFACLEGSDPSGRLVDAGETWLPEDSFYVDFGTDDPFEALEKYGRQLRLATHANPNVYDFPAVCAWYIGVWHTKGAQNHPELSTYKINTTSGMVEEATEIKKSGFLKYSRVGGRLMPDTYAEMNPHGWWDDEHWQRDGYYVAPYETSAKYGSAMHDAGCLAFTYMQPYCGWARQPVSLDFRQLHPDWLCGKDINRSLDYTHPEVQQHLRRVFPALRGHMDGIMIDYCDDHWDPEAVLGGFVDPHATSVSFYRILLKLVKEGLGPESWIHERNLWFPNNDLTLGFIDLQRTSADTDKITPGMATRSGLRWYKNRVVMGYCMDSKDINNSWKVDGWSGSDQDGRRMMLTMACVASSRLLLANSFRDISREALHDLSRTFPYPGEARSARPIDAFSHEGFPRVYDFAVTPQWHQVVLYNNTLPTKEEMFSIPMGGDRVDGALGLDVAKDYYAYDFWNEFFVGRIRGSAKLEQTLRPGEARMLSLHQVEEHPQFISTNRHIMQGWLDFEKYPEWDAKKRELSGASRVIGGEPYRVVIALNGHQPIGVTGGCKIELLDGRELTVLSIERPQNETVSWSVQLQK